MQENKEEQKLIVFVCTGNTCRSPMAEQILVHHLRQRKLDNNVKVESRGLMFWNGGMNDLAAEALKSLNIDAQPHTAKMLETSLVKDATLIVCMEKRHKDLIFSEVGEQGNVLTADDIFGAGDIPDPFGSSLDNYLSTAKKLDELCLKLLEYLGLDSL